MPIASKHLSGTTRFQEALKYIYMGECIRWKLETHGEIHLLEIQGKVFRISTCLFPVWDVLMSTCHRHFYLTWSHPRATHTFPYVSITVKGVPTVDTHEMPSSQESPQPKVYLRSFSIDPIQPLCFCVSLISPILTSIPLNKVPPEAYRNLPPVLPFLFSLLSAVQCHLPKMQTQLYHLHCRYSVAFPCLQQKFTFCTTLKEHWRLCPACSLVCFPPAHNACYDHFRQWTVHKISRITSRCKPLSRLCSFCMTIPLLPMLAFQLIHVSLGQPRLFFKNNPWTHYCPFHS